MPNKVFKGGICSYWSAMFTSFSVFPEIKFDIVKVGNTGKNPFGPFFDQWKFHKASQKELDLVVLNPSILSKAFFREGLFAKQLISKKIPFISFFHGWDINFEKKIDKHFRKFFLNTYGQSKKIITLSPEAKEKILDWGYCGEVIVETTIVDSSLIKNFSMEERAKKIKLGEPISILFLARMERAKGVFELIDAFNELKKEYGSLELILAGNGGAYEEVRQYVKNYQGIEMIGHIESEEKAEVFKKSDIYCLPSYSEGLPVSILEAMAFGLPVVTTRVGGLKYFFEEEKMGYTSHVKDSKDLIKKLKKLIENESHIYNMGEYNFNYAQENLISDKIAKRLYKNLTEI